MGILKKENPKHKKIYEMILYAEKIGEKKRNSEVEQGRKKESIGIRKAEASREEIRGKNAEETTQGYQKVC